MSAPLPFRPVFTADSDRPKENARSVGIPLLEMALIVVTALHLCFLPWALGAMHVWSQLSSLGLATAGIVLALSYRAQLSVSIGSDPGKTRNHNLTRFPIFWAGLVVLGYISVQGLNPAWRFMSNSDFWWLKPITHISWLPSGVDAPFARSNPWRELLIYGSLSLLINSVWIGFLHKKSYPTLFGILVGNAGLLSTLGMLQKLNGARRIFWSYVPSNDGFFASFIYPNHAGAYFNLMVSLAIGLSGQYFQHTQDKRENLGWASLFLFTSIFIGISVVFSNSRMSIILLFVLTALVSALLVSKNLRKKSPERDRRELIPLFFALGLAALVSITLIALQAEKVWARFAPLITQPTFQAHGRAVARQATRDMIADHWLLGWGAGCFRYGFPLYAQKYPDIYYSANGAHQYWEHAHDDLLEFPAELGATGLIPLVAILGYLGWEISRRRVWRNPLSRNIVLGCALLIIHAGVDFVFQNPAVLFTSGVLLISALRWTELDPSNQRRAVESKYPDEPLP